MIVFSIMHDLLHYRVSVVTALFVFFSREETHKVDVIKFSQNKAMECLRNDNLLDKDSASLIWEFIVLLCRQNGVCILLLPIIEYNKCVTLTDEL